MLSERGSGSMGIALNDAVTQMMDEDTDAARSYLFYRWFSEFMECIREEREAKGLTQQQVADLLHTTQSAVARLENDRRGGMSVRRVWEYAFAVGLSPLVELRPASGLMSFVREQPDTWLTVRAYSAWMMQQASVADDITSSITTVMAAFQDASRNANRAVGQCAKSLFATNEVSHVSIAHRLVSAMHEQRTELGGGLGHSLEQSLGSSINSLTAESLATACRRDHPVESFIAEDTRTRAA